VLAIGPTSGKFATPATSIRGLWTAWSEEGWHDVCHPEPFPDVTLLSIAKHGDRKPRARYKWIALSSSALGMLIATINSRLS
jgi:hypothetical protein